MIAGDRELMDRYLCRRISPYDRSTRGYLPVVQVLRVLRWPIQHGILWADAVKENAPVPFGTLCRLEIFGPADEAAPELSLSWEESCREAVLDAACRAVLDGCGGELSILLRHLRGDVRARRVIRIYTLSEAEHGLP